MVLTIDTFGSHYFERMHIDFNIVYFLFFFSLFLVCHNIFFTWIPNRLNNKTQKNKKK